MLGSTMQPQKPVDARKITRAEFNYKARHKQFKEGPYIVSADSDGCVTSYLPPSQREVWGYLKDGSAVWADHK